MKVFLWGDDMDKTQRRIKNLEHIISVLKSPNTPPMYETAMYNRYLKKHLNRAQRRMLEDVETKTASDIVYGE